MKPNPVKKMVEFCHIPKEVSCHYYTITGFCVKYDKKITQRPWYDPSKIERPSWCTDETFLRVKIVPVMDGDVEYCTGFGEKCNMVSVEQGVFICKASGRYWKGDVKRPDKCRKLEVE